MKRDKKKNKKLTQKDFERMWGEGGPYSQVRLCEETRILDDSVSRVFLVVETTINPFTFEYALKNRQKFENDEAVLQLLDHAEYRDEFGYVASAGETELRDEGSKRFARKQADMSIQTIIRMHAFVMQEHGLGKDNGFGVIEDKTPSEEKFVWNEQMGQIEPVKDELWDSKTLVGNSAGVQNNKMRFFVVLAFEKSFDFKKDTASTFAKTLKKVSARFNVAIEEVESFQEYMLITFLIPFDVVPATFIGKASDECNTVKKKPMFQKDYLVTNVERPTPEQIMLFLK